MLHDQRSAFDQNMVLCHCCNCVSAMTEKKEGYTLRCRRCNAAIHLRKVDSVRRTWIFVIIGFITFIPSHVFPVMSISQLGSGTYHKTIMGGVISMADEKLWGLAAIVFIASVVVPLFKLLGLTCLLLAIKYRWLRYRFRLTQMYRVVIFIGRWSMVDIFFAALFISLLQLEALINVQAGYGATAFASMCVITMIAGEFFDPRLLWDHRET